MKSKVIFCELLKNPKTSTQYPIVIAEMCAIFRLLDSMKNDSKACFSYMLVCFLLPIEYML